MDARTTRATALTLGSAAAGGLLLLLLPHARVAAPVVDYRRASPAPAASRPFGGPWRWWLPEELAAELFPMQPPDQPYDPYVYFRWRASHRVEHRFPEHPDGRIAIVTNGLGLREDGEASRRAPTSASW